MPEISTSPLGYVGILAIAFGVFLILAGFGVIKIKQIDVRLGSKTWGIGAFITALGLFFLLPDIIEELSRFSISTPTVVTAVTPTTPSYSATVTPADTLIPDLADTFDGSNETYDTQLWECAFGNCPPTKLFQNDGILNFRIQDTNDVTGLRSYSSWDSESFASLEVKVRLDGSSLNQKYQWLWVSMNDDKETGPECVVGTDIAQFDTPILQCNVRSPENPREYSTEAIPIVLDTWYDIRIERNVSTGEYSFFQDDKLIGKHIWKYPSLTFHIVTGLWAEGKARAYVDDITLEVYP